MERTTLHGLERPRDGGLEEPAADASLLALKRVDADLTPTCFARRDVARLG